MKFTPIRFLVLVLLAAAGFAATAAPGRAATAETPTRTVTDAAGRSLTIPETVERVICSGPGALRLLTYLQAQRLAVAADDIEGRRSRFDARPYALANPGFRDLPVFGEFRGHDNPERIVSLSPAPQVILKAYGNMGHDPVELQEKTRIPVVILDYGDFGAKIENFYQALRIMAEVVGKKERAEAVIAYFEAARADLKKRAEGVPDGDRKRCYLGGVAQKGPHGFTSTEIGYPPLALLGAVNVADQAATPGMKATNTDVAKEKIVEWNPDILLLDLSTLQLGDEAGGLFELKTDPAYQTLDAVKKDEVYGVLPYNWYSINHDCLLADAYFLGALLYPERFADIVPAAKADEIFAFLVGKPVFARMNELFKGLAFARIPLK